MKYAIIAAIALTASSIHAEPVRTEIILNIEFKDIHIAPSESRHYMAKTDDILIEFIKYDGEFPSNYLSMTTSNGMYCDTVVPNKYIIQLRCGSPRDYWYFSSGNMDQIHHVITSK